MLQLPLQTMPALQITLHNGRYFHIISLLLDSSIVLEQYYTMLVNNTHNIMYQKGISSPGQACKRCVHHPSWIFECGWAHAGRHCTHSCVALQSLPSPGVVHGATDFGRQTWGCGRNMRQGTSETVRDPDSAQSVLQHCRCVRSIACTRWSTNNGND